MKPPEELVAKAERLQENGYDQEAFQIWKNLAKKNRSIDLRWRSPTPVEAGGRDR